MDPCVIRRARDGDPHAAGTLVESLRPRISKMAAYYGRVSGEDADDLQQEAWLGLLEALPEIDMHIGTPEQYLIARARWKLLDAIKRARVRRCLPLDDAMFETLPSTGPEAAVASACATEFRCGLKRSHQVVLDCLMAGLTWRETGEMLGCTSANVAYYVRQIKRRFEEWCEDVAPAL